MALSMDRIEPALRNAAWTRGWRTLEELAQGCRMQRVELRTNDSPARARLLLAEPAARGPRIGAA